MSQNRLRVGTITANYNNADYIPECINGILSQKVKPDHITIVDDQSTDNSWEVIQTELKKLSPSLHWFDDNTFVAEKNGIKAFAHRKPKNSGPAATRNVALNYLLDKTEAICIADSDDVLYPDKISKSLEVMKAYPQVALVYSDYDILTQKDGHKRREYKEIYSYRRLFEECIVSNNSLIATNIVNMIGAYDESLKGPEDYDLWLRIAEIAAVYHIPESLYQYRVTGNNITITTPSMEFAQQVQRVKQKVMERRNVQQKR